MRYNSEGHSAGITEVETWMKQYFSGATMCVVETPWGLDWHVRVTDGRSRAIIMRFHQDLLADGERVSEELEEIEASGLLMAPPVAPDAIAVSLAGFDIERHART
jgi:hypothetical protein